MLWFKTSFFGAHGMGSKDIVTIPGPKRITNQTLWLSQLYTWFTVPARLSCI